MPRSKKASGAILDDAPIGTPLAHERRRGDISPVFASRMRVDTPSAHRMRLVRAGFLDVCKYYLTTSLSWEEIRRGRATVERLWLEQSGLRTPGEQHKLSTSDLNRMFVLYDWHFFGGSFERALSEKAEKLEIIQPAVLSKPSSRTSALCIQNGYGHKCTYTIELTRSVGKYFDPDRYGNFAIYDDESAIPAYSVGGLLSRSWLECTQLLLEHEMVHLLMYMWLKCEDPDKALGGMNHGATWRLLARNIFGHYKHTSGLSKDLVILGSGRAEREWEAAELVRRKLRVGMHIAIADDVLCSVHSLPEATEQNEHFEARSARYGTLYVVRYLEPIRIVRGRTKSAMRSVL